MIALYPEFVEGGEHRGNGVGGAAVNERRTALMDDQMDRVEERHQIFGIDGIDAAVVPVSNHRPPSATALES